MGSKDQCSVDATKIDRFQSATESRVSPKFEMASRRALALRGLTGLQNARIAASAVRTGAVQAPLAGRSAAIAARPAVAVAPRRAYSTAEEPKKDDAEAAAEPVEEAPKEELIQETEVVTGAASHHTFKAETRRLLDIVANSLYTDREVFVRELASNASDACEKLRYLQLSEQAAELDPEIVGRPLEISISVDKAAGTFIIQDAGVGMTYDELNENLGTIARSGTKAFVETLESSQDSARSARDSLIGQFGVGFYSALMVADKVKVYTRSARKDSKGYCWSTDGSGAYDISEAEGVAIGTKIVLHLKPNSTNFSDRSNVESIVKKHSAFVSFPIKINGQPVATVGALWTRSPSEITDEQHAEFYRFIAHAYDDPQYRLQYRTDSPLSIRALLYVPERHSELFGMGRMEPGVSLYSRKVLIQAKSKNLLPEWLRFVKGVVDSEDIPLNISREHMQDSLLINKLKDVVTGRIVKWLDEESRRDAEKFAQFWRDFGLFIKEGVCVDAKHRKDAAKLLRFESSAEGGKLSSLKEYVGRMKEDQKYILYSLAPTRELASESPYVEPLVKMGYEVGCGETGRLVAVLTGIPQDCLLLRNRR